MVGKGFNLLAYSSDTEQLLEMGGDDEYLENILDNYESFIGPLKAMDRGEYSSKELFNEYFRHIEGFDDRRVLNQVIDYAERCDIVSITRNTSDIRFTVPGELEEDQLERIGSELEFLEAQREIEEINGPSEDAAKTYLTGLRDQRPKVYDDVRSYGSDVASEILQRDMHDTAALGTQQHPWEKKAKAVNGYRNSLMALEDLRVVRFSRDGTEIDPDDVSLFKDVLSDQQGVVLDSRQENIDGLQSLMGEYG